MTPPRRSQKSQGKQASAIEELRAQLDEANETLRAIREGEVDAIVVSGKSGEQVFSLVGAESIYRLIVETMKEAAFTLTFDGKILYCNNQLAEFLKRPINQILGHELNEFVDPANHAAAESLLIGAQEHAVRQRLVFADSDGHPTPAHISTSVLNQPDGLSICVVATDLTELENSTEALRESEERFRQVTETISDFVWEVDADGLYAYTSPAVERILGYTPDELVGKMHFYDLFAPDVREQLKRSAAEVFMAQQRFRTLPTNNVSKSGKIVCLETSGVPVLDKEGRLLRYRCASTDVTKRYMAEAETHLLREKLTHFSRIGAVNELTASIAHELNQPLAAILSNAQTALRLMIGEASDLKEVREILEDIVADNKRATEVIRSIRSVLKSTGSERHSLSINDLVKDVLSITRSYGLAMGVTIVLDLGAPIPPIIGDRIQLQQVILNLVTNAFESMEGSKGTRELKLRTRHAGGEITLDVMDSGFGILPDKLETIFEPFFTTKETGLGVGLALSRSIVRSHNGRLWADHRSEGGATFHMVLPVAEVSVAVHEEAGLNAETQKQTDFQQAPDEGQRIRVLLADDHHVVRQGIANLLSDSPYIEIVGAAGDGLEAVELAAKLIPDIILMDISMPKLDGIEATRRINKEYPQICIIGFSMFEDVERIQAMRAGGALLYIRKSAPADELINTIRQGARLSKIPSKPDKTIPNLSRREEQNGLEGKTHGTPQANS
ncbi:MAG TPA: PAS domain S-box protein [Acidobacteriota bacterium]|nr:PAS domain S-box protein [Acidobacteriota bacterium]